MEPKPTKGRIVNFNTATNGEAGYDAALVVGVSGDRITVVSWNDLGTSTTRHNIEQGTEPGTWAWPTRS